MWWRRLLWPLYRQLLLRSKRPILVGPWRSEVGFEALYWLPFLNELRKTAKSTIGARMIPLSRGGAGVWYGCPQYVELYSLRTPQQLRVQQRLDWEHRKSEKQLRVTAFDRALYRDAVSRLGLSKYWTLHPAWMYATLSPYWDGHKGLQWLAPRVEWSPVLPPPLPEGCPALPDHFAAVRFYDRPTFRSSKFTQSAAIATLERLAVQLPVILLESDAFLDDHTDFTLPSIPNVTRLKDLVPLRPDTNLAIQSAILGRASLFVGTYGGFAQLALRMGKPVLSYFETWNYTCLAHHHLSSALAIQFNLPFHVQRLQEIPWLLSILPAAVVTTPDQPTLDMSKTVVDSPA